jgi:hypothetical protein
VTYKFVRNAITNADVIQGKGRGKRGGEMHSHRIKWRSPLHMMQRLELLGSKPAHGICIRGLLLEASLFVEGRGPYKELQGVTDNPSG